LLSEKVIIPEVGKHVVDDGFSFHRYIVGSPFKGRRIRHSTVAINDGRQSMGIYNTFSFILEGKQYHDMLTRIEHRTNGQFAAISGFLKTVALYRRDIIEIVSSARKTLVETDTAKDVLIPIRMDYFPDPENISITLPVFDLYSWQRVERELGNYEPKIMVKKSIKKPWAYVIPADDMNLVNLFIRHQIKMHKLRQEISLPVEGYTILHVTPFREEDKPSLEVDVLPETKQMTLDKGQILVFLDQPAGLLIPLLLEPQSSWGIVTRGSGQKDRFEDYLREGRRYPIGRILEPFSMDTKPFKIE
jgi:hypothetical protein